MNESNRNKFPLKHMDLIIEVRKLLLIKKCFRIMFEMLEKCKMRRLLFHAGFSLNYVQAMGPEKS